MNTSKSYVENTLCLVRICTLAFFFTFTFGGIPVINASNVTSASITLENAKSAYKQKNYVAALKGFRQLAEDGNAIAAYNYGLMLFKGKGIEKDTSAAIKWFRKAAVKGIVQAQLNLAHIYDLGKVVIENQHEALKWYRMAAIQGDSAAQYYLGQKFDLGDGVKQSHKEAVKWYLKAATQGNSNAQVNLAFRYLKGDGVKQNVKEGFKWMLKAAEQGEILAQSKVASMYQSGQGSLWGNNKEAVKWYRKAAEQGDANAQFNLAWKYNNGQGVKQDYAEAVKWYRKAAEQGDANAQFNLGVMHGNGQGVLQSTSAAIDWYYEAGLSYLKQEKRDKALGCVDRIKNLSKTNQTVPNSFLANNLFEKIYDRNKSKKSSPKAKEKKMGDVVSGTGWTVVGGYVVTNHHVIAGHHDILLVRRDGVKIKATVVVDDATNDLALLKPVASNKLPPALPLANQPVQVGEQVFTVGYPHPGLMGIEPKLTQGIINARTGIKNDPRTYQISVPLQGGNSGGPLINMRGEVVGVVTAKMSAIKVFKWSGDLPQNVNYAVKSGYIQILLSSINPAESVSVLPVKKDDLESLAKRIEGSVMMIIAK